MVCFALGVAFVRSLSLALSLSPGGKADLGAGVGWAALVYSNLLLYLSSISDLKHGPRPIFEWTPSPSPFDLSPSPSSSARRPPPVGVFYWTRDAPEESDEVAEEVGELGESRSSDETAVGVGGEEEVSSARGEKGKGGLSGVAMMPGLERE